jgi:shikimate dehydrogenase
VSATTAPDHGGREPGRRAAVLGSPVGHSLSPLLHRAAYAALGLDWRYDAVECDADALPGLVDGLGPEWVGLSVTMPGKRAALARADSRTERATAVGAANTLVRQADGGWLADCTDVDGVSGALAAAGWTGPRTGTAVLLGGGATAAATIAALAGMGLRRVVILVRDPARARYAAACAERFGIGVRVDVLEPGTADVGGVDLAGADVVVSTLPAGVVDGELADALAGAPLVLDVVYHPWPTPVALAVSARGGRLATGLDMLLHQAFGQVEQFTGRPAPREAMRAALPQLDAVLPE